MAIETALGDGLYLDTRCDSFVWRGRVNKKPTRKVIRHPQTDAVATTNNMTKTEARRIAKDMSADAANGGGKYFPAPAGGITVRDAWDIYMKRDGSKRKSAGEKRSHWTRFLEPAIGGMALANVTRKDCASIVSKLLTEVTAKGENGNAALNLQKNMKRFFNWCADEGYGDTHLEQSPMVAMKARPIDVKLTKRPARALDDRELVWLYRALERFAATPRPKTTAEGRRRQVDATEALLRSMCRRNEVLDSDWSVVRDDGFLVPKDKAKNGHPILVPWSDSFRALVGTKPDDVETTAKVFGGSAGWLARTIEDVRVLMNEIAREDGFNGDFCADKIDGVHNPHYFSLHDFRDTSKTWLARQLGEDDMPIFPREVQESCLNHREQGVGAIYNADLDDPRWFFSQRKRAGDAWNAYLDGLKAKALETRSMAA